jgi:hypothetical protein
MLARCRSRMCMKKSSYLYVVRPIGNVKAYDLNFEKTDMNPYYIRLPKLLDYEGYYSTELQKYCW